MGGWGGGGDHHDGSDGVYAYLSTSKIPFSNLLLEDHTSVNLPSSLSFPKLTTTSSKDLSVTDTASACSASSLVGGAPILTTSFRDGQCLACFNMAATLLAPHTTTGMDTVRGGRGEGGGGREGEGGRDRGMGRGREGWMEGWGGGGRDGWRDGEGERGGGREGGVVLIQVIIALPNTPWLMM